MDKSPEAFRTISEVADWLGVPTHVLRFWESRFSQIKPVKRAGGRRYYRPSDMSLIGGIKRLLHDEGMTIRGAQKLLREKGVKHVAAMSQPLDGTSEVAAPDVIEATAVEVTQPDETPTPEAVDTVVEPDAEPAAEPDIAEANASEPAPVDTPITGPGAVTIPPTPDVPDNDPDDADTSFPANPGLAVRLLAADRGYLRRNRDALRVVKDLLPSKASA